MRVKLKIWQLKVLYSSTSNKFGEIVHKVIPVGPATIQGADLPLNRTKSPASDAVSHLKRGVEASQAPKFRNVGKKTGGYNLSSNETLDHIIRVELPQFGIAETAAVFVRYGGVSGKGNKSVLRKHLPALARHLEHLPSDEWTLTNISDIIRGLQCLEENDDGYLYVLSTMSKMATACIKKGNTASHLNLSSLFLGLQRNVYERRMSRKFRQIMIIMVQTCEETLSGESIGNIMHGLKAMSSTCSEVLQLISALVPKIKGCQEQMSTYFISRALYGLQRLTSEHKEVLLLLSALAPKVEHSVGQFTDRNIANALYGLRGMSSGSHEVSSLLRCLTTKIVSSGNIEFGPQAVGNSLYGLQGMSSDCSEVVSLISALVSKVEGCNSALSAQEVGNALYGLQGMKSDVPEVRCMLSALTITVRNCLALDPQAVGNSLYGLQGMSSCHRVVNSLIAALVPKIEESFGEMSRQEIGNALYGLQRMSCEVLEVRYLISALTTKVKECRDKFDCQAVGNSLYGLQGMSSDCREVVSLISALVPRVEGCNGALSAQEVGNALYGLRGMRSDVPEVQSLLSALLPKLLRCRQSLSGQNVGNALLGFHGMLGPGSDSASSLPLLKFLQSHLPNSSDMSALSTSHAVTLGQAIVLSRSLLQRCLLEDDITVWEETSSILAEELKLRDLNDGTAHAPTSTSEVSVHKVAEDIFSNSKVTVSNNGFIFDLFECDILLRIPIASIASVSHDAPSSSSHTDISSTDDVVSANRQNFIAVIPGEYSGSKTEVDAENERRRYMLINIEVDGWHHRMRKKMRFCAMRDAYLRSQGVVVERLDVSLVRGMSEEALRSWILDCVARNLMNAK